MYVAILNNGISCLQRQPMMQELLQMKNLLFFKMLVTWVCMVEWMLMISIRKRTWRQGRKSLIIWEAQNLLLICLEYRRRKKNCEKMKLKEQKQQHLLTIR